jgi:hypothetical protein
MRKVLAVLLAVSLVALATGAGAGADGQGADQLAAGTATLVGFGQPMVHVNAQSGVNGVNPRGHFWIRYPNGGADFGGHVVCLTVVGNSAAMTGHIERVNVANPGAGFVLDNYLIIRLTDNGSPGALDLVNFDPGFPDQPAGCAGVGDLPISQGNYVVHNRPVIDPLELDLLNQFLAQIESAANDPYG